MTFPKFPKLPSSKCLFDTAKNAKNAAAQVDPKAVADAALAGARSAATKGLDYATKNPKNTACAGAMAGGLLVTVMPAALTGPFLAVAGFGSSGPVEGTMAAAFQAWYGNVGAGSVFATLQSGAMGGYGAATLAAVAKGTGAAVATVGAAVRWLNRAKL